MNKIILVLWITTALFADSVEVNVIKQKQSTQAVTIQADGLVIAKNKSIITAKANGIVELFIDNNSNVVKGDKIVEIVDERRRQKLKLLKTKLVLVKNEMKSQEVKLIDAKEMYKMGVGSKNNYLNEQVLNEQLKENFQTLNGEYIMLQLEQKNSIIYASEDGTITNLIASNTYISYGATIASFISKKSVVKLFVDATYAYKLTKGGRVKLQNSYKDTNAIISNILPTSTNNLLEVIVIPKSNLPHNLQVNAIIELRSIHGVTLPKKAIVLVENHPCVYIIKNGVAHLKYVEILKDMVDKVLIRETLNKESQIAVNNTYILHDNLEVKVK